MASLPKYLTMPAPIPLAARDSWRRNIMPLYLCVALWFVFWQDLVVGGIRENGHPGGTLVGGFLPPFFGIVLGAAICHFLLYMTPAQLGMRTGLPLAVVGSSTYGARGGQFLPGLLVGLLQFGWLAVIAWFVGDVICQRFHWGVGGSDFGENIQQWPRGAIVMLFTLISTFIALRGIRSVVRTAMWLSLIPIAILLILLVLSASGMSGLTFAKLTEHMPRNSPAVNPDSGFMGNWQIVSVLCVYVTSYFALFGLCGADVATVCRGNNDVHVGGISGIFMPYVLIGELLMLILAGLYGGDFVRPEHRGIYNPIVLMPDLFQARFGNVWGPRCTDIAMIGLALSSFAVASFASMLAINNLWLAIPRVSPAISAGVGAAVAGFLAFTGFASCGREILPIIGAAIAPICGAMTADFLMSGLRWSGPRAGFNPAGWISWLVGFAAGSFNCVVELMLRWHWGTKTFPNMPDYQNYIFVPLITAYVIGFCLYVGLSVLGLRTRRLLTADGKLIDSLENS